MGALIAMKRGTAIPTEPRQAPATSSAAAADLVRSSARRLEGLSGREFRREVDRLLEALGHADAIGFHDATLMLQAEARFGAFFAAAAGPVLGADLAWSDGEQSFAEWASRAHVNWARIAAEYAKLEIAAIGPESPLAPRLVAIALARQGDAIKWRAMAGRCTSDHSLLHRIFHLADSAGFARAITPIVRDGAVVRASPQSLYLRALLFDAFCTGTLTRPGMEIADTWLLAWSHSLGLAEDPPSDTGAGVPHVDLAGADGLGTGLPAPLSSVRYVTGLETVRTRLREMRRALQAGRAPAGYPGAAIPLDQYVAALCRLDEILEYWLGAAEHREPRTVVRPEIEADCYVGIGEIAGRGPLAQGSGLATAGPAEEPGIRWDDAPRESRFDRHEDYGFSDVRIGRRARVADRSASGLGLVVPRWHDGHPMLGDLMAVRLGGEMIVGRVVRRFAQPGTDGIRIGLRRVARDPARVTLVDVSPGMTRAAREVTALFVPGQDPSGSRDALIVPANAVRPEARFELTLAGQAYTVRLDCEVDAGRGWLCTRFEALERRPA